MSSFKTIKITRIDETNKRFEILFDNSSPTVLNDYKAHIYKNDLIIKDELSGNVDRINFRQVQVRSDESSPYQTFDNGRLLDEYLFEIGFYPNKCCSTESENTTQYKIYRALINQEKEDNPTLIVLENTTGLSINFTRVSVGRYTSNTINTLPNTTKYAFTCSNVDENIVVAALVNNVMVNQFLDIRTKNYNGSNLEDGNLKNNLLELFIY
jgi:hypothetical protein